MVSDFFQIALSAMVPVTELRLTIPLFLSTRGDLAVWFVVIAAIAGNMVPNFFLLWFFPRATEWLHGSAGPWVNRFVQGLHGFFIRDERVWWLYMGLFVVVALSSGYVAEVYTWYWVVPLFLVELLVFYVGYRVLLKIHETSKSHLSVIHWFYEKVHAEHSDRFIRYGSLALVLFVGIPLPGSGSWTGSLLAFLFGISYWRAIGLIFVGIVISAGIVTGLSTGVISLF
jgi:uncharacterized membrane protein